MKIKSCKLFKILSCLLFGGVTLVSCATPLIVSCSDSSNNNSNNNQDNVDKYWWPKEVLVTNEQVWKCIDDYKSKYWENNMPSSVRLSSFKKFATYWGIWDDSMSNITFEGFNKIKVNSSIVWPEDLVKDNPKKESCVEFGASLYSPNYYYKDTGYKLKAYKTDKEPSVPVYAVYSNINNILINNFDIALYIEDLQAKVNNKILFPSDTFRVAKPPSFDLSNWKLANFYLKFYIAKAVDAENLGGYYNEALGVWKMENSLIENAIDGFENNTGKYTAPPNDGNYDW